MSQTITVANYGSRNLLESTTLDDDVASGQADITVQSVNNIAADSILLIGKLGSENVEKIVVDSVSGLDVTATANLSRSFSRFDPVNKLYGDKIRIYRASNVDGTTPDDGDFSLLATTDIDFDQAQTSYTDATGSSDYWYKFTYYNSIADSETSIADSTAKRGGGYGNYVSIESIRTEAGLTNNKYITDDIIDDKRQAAQSLINATLTGKYTIPFTEPINQLIQEITRVLAAGYVLTQQHGTVNSSTYNEGVAMIERITNDKQTGILDRLNLGTLTLIGETGTTEETVNASDFKGWPNGDTATASSTVGGAPRGTRMSDRY
ncbi:MAG TPA: hypothetical protein PKD15_00805 [Candidatus Saccharibacteria bacterium]|nr:hypothetical protein [Candidatus Saccharibacteria bacterium]